MSKQDKQDKQDKIAAKHGCELQPTAFGGVALVILPRYQGERHEERLTRCKAALEAAGVLPDGLVS
jgi:hypothetical protein